MKIESTGQRERGRERVSNRENSFVAQVELVQLRGFVNSESTAVCEQISAGVSLVREGVSKLVS